jgi:5-aminopentanamidase
MDLNVAVIQTSPIFGEVKKNTAAALKLIPPGCDLAVLPELFSTGYQFKSRAEAVQLGEVIGNDSVAGSTTRELSTFAADTGTTLVAGMAEVLGDSLFNSAVLLRPDGSREIYRKVHLFFDEKVIFDAGDLGFPVFEACGTKIGMMVCFDWIFPESARSLALAGAKIIAHPSNLVLPWCPAAMITRSQENRVHTITSNRIGEEHRTADSLKFIGMSQVVSPLGERLVELGKDRVGAGSAMVRILAGDSIVTQRNEIWGDRRPDMYRS